jgi:hypothetical protein
MIVHQHYWTSGGWSVEGRCHHDDVQERRLVSPERHHRGCDDDEPASTELPRVSRHGVDRCDDDDR